MPSFLGHPRAKTVLLPAPVYATWNPAGTNPNITLSNGNLTAEVTGPPPSTAYGTATNLNDNFDIGKRYLEVHLDAFGGSSSGVAVGFCDTDQSPGYELGDLEYAYAWRADGYAESNGVPNSYGTPATVGDVVQLAIHAYVDGAISRARIWFGLNGSWFGGGDPAVGTFPAFSDVPAPLATDWSVRVTMRSQGDRLSANFGSSDFVYLVPPGFGRGWGINIS